MDKSLFFFYKAYGRTLYLNPELHVSAGTVLLRGATIYNANGDYLGHWEVSNMPVEVKASMLKWAKFNRSVEIAKLYSREAKRKQRQF